MFKKSIALCCAIIVHLNSNKFDCLYYVCDSLMKDYFYKPPINQLSLTFLDKSLESAYRISYQEEVCIVFSVIYRNVSFHLKILFMV